ncbi:G-protein coupled receptor moody isoform X2 [Macrosteles quadrilineatus]|uniref:G-protein coupled receptor moody isoform X2 n=1 Tax=Macrosteles quadrilineatus TaxID=74068 RepID=UPI0023E2B3B7|nr:G-protein coupled receptor moody isoform X2 [Macrosteles quadrilineatus]
MMRELRGFASLDGEVHGFDPGDSFSVSNSTLEQLHSDDRFSTTMLKLATLATVVIMVVGIVGNSLTVVALLRCPRVRNVAAAFIISLCIVDCLFCILVLPFSALAYYHGTWKFGDTLCKIVPLIRYANVGESLLCIAMITINRYVMIAHYGVYTKIYRPIWIASMILFCCTLSFLMQVPTFLGIWGKYAYDDKIKSCTIVQDENGRSSKTALFIIAFVIPCLIIICCYARIFWVVHSSESRMRKHASSNAKDTRTGKEKKDQKNRRNEWRITKMVLAIFLSFLLSYLPITVVKVVDSNVERPALHVWSTIMLFMSACINPIIYVIMNKQYRQAYKTVLTCTRPRMLSTTPGPGSSYGGSNGLILNDLAASRKNLANTHIINTDQRYYGQ